MREGAKIVLCTPVMETVQSSFYIDAMRLAQRMTYLAMKGGPGFSVLTRQSSNLSDKRHFMVQRVLDDGWATHILWIDSDMTFDQNIAYSLLQYDKPIVAAACPTKMVPSFSTAVMQRGPSEFAPVDPSQCMGLVPVDFVGLGIALIDVAVYKTVPPPWFEVVWRPERECYEGEDWYFLRKAKEHGFTPYIDAEASTTVGHTGSFTFAHGLTYSEGLADERSPLDPPHGEADGSLLPLGGSSPSSHVSDESEGGKRNPSH